MIDDGTGVTRASRPTERPDLWPSKIVSAVTVGWIVVGFVFSFGLAYAGATRAAAPDVRSNTNRTTSSTIWPGWGFDSARSGYNPAETTLGPTNVTRLTVRWRRLLPDGADGAPAYDGSRLFFTLKGGGSVALDRSNGNQLWTTTATGPNITTSSPILDPAGGFVYSYGLDGFVHKYGTSDGSETVGSGWPVQVTLLPSVEKGSSSLNIANGRLYATTGGYPGDAGHYEGHLVAIDLTGGHKVVFNALCSNLHVLLTDQIGQPNYCTRVQAGVWARAGGVVDPTNGNIFIGTGNGEWTGSTAWGDSVLELSADATTLIDTYTPANQEYLHAADLDLGSTAPALLPRQAGSTTPLLAVQGGKDDVLRLLNRQNLSGQGAIGKLGGELGTVAAPGSCEVLSQPAVWIDPTGVTWIFVANDCGISGYTVTTDRSGHTTLGATWQQSAGGTSPVLANGVLYVARNGEVDARDPVSGSLLWSSVNTTGGAIGAIHWQSPIVVDGNVFIVDESGWVTAYSVVIPDNLPFRLSLPLIPS